MAARAGTDEENGSLWEHTAPAPPDAPPLDEEATADVVVVGGGYTGSAAALRLAEAGRSVRLLEARGIGHGGSGRNVGLLNAGLWMPPDEVEATLGRDAGRRLNAALAAGPALVFSLIDRHGIACEDTRTGTLHLAHSPAGLGNLKARHAQALARGWPVEILDAAETRRRTGTDVGHGALLDHRAGTVQPLAYVRGLAAAAARAGARLHAHSPAIAVEESGGGWRVATEDGSVTAEWLVMATNAYHTGLEGLPAPRYTPVHYFQCATRPLSENLLSAILPERQGVWDTATVMSSFRRDAAGRLVVGGIGSLGEPGAPVHRDWARRKLARLFPDVPDEPFEHAWFGRIAMTADHLPRIVSLGERAVAVYGYSGRGIAPGTVFGTAVGDYVLGADPSALPLPPTTFGREPLAGLKRLWFEAGATAFHLVSGRLPARRAPR